MASDVIGSTFRTGSIAALVTLTILGAGTAFKITGNTLAGKGTNGSGSILQIWANSGAQVGKMNASGSLILSGSTIIGHRKTGTGELLIKGTKGGLECRDDPGGAACTCCWTNAGTQFCRVGITAECSPRDAQ